MRPPSWSLGLKQLIEDPWRWMALRLADFDPVRAEEIEERSTLTEIAEALTVRMHDNSFEHRDGKGRIGR